MIESRLTDIESTLAFQERTIQDLSDVICGQQTELDSLKAEIKKLTERLNHDALPGGDGADAPPELPPHY
ncbi:MAG: SlyX family protein [Verrucomicrobia bacterium]|jgi:uncharacterized coiled-coil protein SlyX|nr:SlyX family protein [Verrucomicrobiota bacterium]